ncbi:MAG: transcriptional regulator FtsR [Streptosporangiaceae bacterium]
MSGQFARSYLGIGEVLVELRSEFPEVSVSKIRFLESEGLISPARSPSGYRRFSPADVEQLRFVLTAQRDEYLPLRVIRERLAERGQPAPEAGQADRPEPGAADGKSAGSRPGSSEMVSRRELLDAAGIDDAALDELEAHGLVRRVGRLYGQDALDVAATVAALAAHGVQARHLRTVRTAAERDVSLIEQLVAPTLRQRSPAARQQASQTARQIAALMLRLHRAMIESALAEAGLPGSELPDDRPLADGADAGRTERPAGRTEPSAGRRGASA